MAATFNESQKIDYLWKKVGYAVTKTAESTVKEAFNESIPSPLLYRGDLVWMQSDQITASPPASTTSIIQVYKDGVGSFSPSVECTEDLTSPDNQTWKTNAINWVPTQFGDNYLVQVYVANSGVTNPQTSGTKLFQAGSGTDDTWFFDYQSGVLNFNGSNVPSQIASPITGKSVYIVGYRYVGLLGVTNLPSNTAIGNLNFTGTTISSSSLNGNIVLTPNGSGIVQVSSSLTSNGNITANFFIGNGSQLTGVAASNAVTAGTVTANAQPNITSVGTLISLDITGNLTAGNANLGNLVIANYFSGSGNLLSNIQGSNVTGNVTSAITANFANYAGNVTVSSQPNITSVGTLISLDVTGNGSFGNISMTGSGGNITGANVVSANTFSGNLTATSSNVTSNSITNNLTVNLALSGNTANFTGNIISLNANLGNAASANYFIGNGSLLTGVAASNAVTAGTVTANAQPNITSVGTLISLDITGNLTAGNANLGNLVIANYFSGSGNMLSNIQGANVSGQVGNALVAGTVYTNAQPNITSVGTLTSLDVSGHLIANTFQMGYGVYAFYSTSVYFATTASTANNQVLWSYTAADLSAIDFTIIATDATGSTRQTCKISAAILGTTVAFNEYGGLFINGGVGSFGVVYNGSGPTPTLDLVVTPDSSNLTEYNMLISKYLV